MKSDDSSISLVSFDLTPQWNAVMDIYDVFADIANRHELRFYLGFGSVLGAVRHGGFIPWDDDFDVEMSRADYETFREIAQRELPSHLKWVDSKNSPEFLELFGKIVDTRREVYDQVVAKTGIHFPQGLYIDVFPMDGCPVGVFSRFRRWIRRNVLRAVMSYRFGAPPIGLKAHVVRFFGRTASILLPNVKNIRDVRDLVDKRVRTCTMETADYCGTPTPSWQDMINIEPVAVFGEPRMVPFHGRTVPIPQDYDTYLRRKFGDYMQLPPKDQRCLPYHAGQPDAPWKFGPTCGQ